MFDRFCLKFDGFLHTISRVKLLRHATPMLLPPPNVDVQAISKDLVKKASRLNPTDEEKAAYVDQILRTSQHDPPAQDYDEEEDDLEEINEDLNEITTDKMLNIFKKNSSSPWGWLESDKKFYFYKTALPPDMDADNDQDLPLSPIMSECLVIDKSRDFKMTLTRRGEQIELNYVAPLDFSPKFQTIYPRTLDKVHSFIKKLKARNDPIPAIPEVLQMTAQDLSTMGKWCLKHFDRDEKLGSALRFLANQLNLWSSKFTSEHNKSPSFVPSAIRLALLVRAQSKQAYSVSKNHA